MAEEQTPLMKHAWIDDREKVIFFLDTTGTRLYVDKEAPFWTYVMGLVKEGYRIG